MSIQTDFPLILLSERFAVCRLSPDAADPDWARFSELLCVTRTRSELSIICAERLVPPEVRAQRGFRALMVQGQLDFSLTGILASIAVPLARAGVSIFALSTFDTDYVLVGDDSLGRAVEALTQVGFLVLKESI